MIYSFIFVLLFMAMIGYINLANRIGIIDEPNKRSSHKKPTIRGGGIIFPVAIVLWACFFDHSSWLFTTAIVLIGTLGFFDDRYSLSQISRLIIQSIAVGLILLQLDILMSNILFVILTFILITGWLNTFNFMDGINGLSMLYALSIIIGIYLFKDLIPQVDISLVIVIVISLMVFGWYNVRVNAIVFAGDVGSLSMGLILAYLISNLIITSGRWEFIVFVSVYGVDSVLTILHRLLNKENIFKAHRSHLYQYLANEMKINQLTVSIGYAFLQFCIIYGFFIIEKTYWTVYSVSCLVMLTLIYTILKARIVSSKG